MVSGVRAERKTVNWMPKRRSEPSVARTVVGGKVEVDHAVGAGIAGGVARHGLGDGHAGAHRGRFTCTRRQPDEPRDREEGTESFHATEDDDLLAWDPTRGDAGTPMFCTS